MTKLSSRHESEGIQAGGKSNRSRGHLRSLFTVAMALVLSASVFAVANLAFADSATKDFSATADDGTVITVTAPSDAFSESTTLTVAKVADGTDTATEITSALDASSVVRDGTAAYQLTFTDADGKTVTAADGSYKVSITFPESNLVADADASTLAAQQIVDGKPTDATSMTDDEAGNATVAFTTTSLSPVIITYSNSTASAKAATATSTESLGATLAAASSMSISQPSGYTDFSSTDGDDYVYLFLSVNNVSTDLKKKLAINSAGWFTVGRIKLPSGMVRANNVYSNISTMLQSPIETSWSMVTSYDNSRYCWKSGSSYVNSAYQYQSDIAALVKSYAESGQGIDYFTRNSALTSQIIKGIDWNHYDYGLCLSSGAPDYSIPTSRRAWHLDGYLCLAYNYTVVCHYDDNGDGTYENSDTQVYTYQSTDAGTNPTSNYTNKAGYTYVSDATNWVDHNGTTYTSDFTLNTKEPVIAGSTNEATLNLYFLRKNPMLTITKSVAGNFGDKTQQFGFTLSLTDDSGNAYSDASAMGLTNNGDGTYSFSLSDKGSISIVIPYGYSYSITESDPDAGSTGTAKYTTTTTISGADPTPGRTATGSNLTANASVTYTNTKDITPDVGVNLGSSAPYVAGLLAIGVAAFGFFKSRIHESR